MSAQEMFRERRALTRHWCDRCGNAIEPGELYLAVAMPSPDGRHSLVNLARHYSDDCTPVQAPPPPRPPVSRGYYWADVKPCGTLAAARRHYRRGEKPCRSCMQAMRRYQEDRRRTAA